MHSALDVPSLGSLLVKHAWARGESPATMARRIGVGWEFWVRDIDRSVGHHASLRLANEVGLPADQLRARMLLSLLDRAGVPTRRSGFQAWVNPVGVYHRERLRYGQLFCSACLQGGCKDLPVEWRLGSAWVCRSHGLLLRDSCGHCDAPFAPYRHDSLMLARCSQCDARLAQVDGATAPLAERKLQAAVRDVWLQALIGNTWQLRALHDALTHAAKSQPEFRGAGEAWTFWRVEERRSLLVSVTQRFIPNMTEVAPAPSSFRRQKPVKRRRGCARLPKDPSAHAEMLLNLALRVKFARRPKARYVRPE